jgi:hypothetical protein
MLRWRHDKPIAEADTLDALKTLLAGQGGRQGERLGRFMPSSRGGRRPTRRSRSRWALYVPWIASLRSQ